MRPRLAHALAPMLAVALLPLGAAAEAIAPLAPLDAFPPQLIPRPLDLDRPGQPNDADGERTAPAFVIEAPSRGSGWLIRRLSPPEALPVQLVPSPVAPVPPVPPSTGAQPWTPPAADSAPAPETDSGVDLIERGVGTLLDNLMREMAPTFDSMAEGLDDLAARFGPVLEDLGTLIDDVGNYQAPERLPNGDILIRRKPDAPPPPAFGGEVPAPAPTAPYADPSRPEIEL